MTPEEVMAEVQHDLQEIVKEEEKLVDELRKLRELKNDIISSWSPRYKLALKQKKESKQ